MRLRNEQESSDRRAVPASEVVTFQVTLPTATSEEPTSEEPTTVCPSCGRVGHQRRNHRSCLQNPANMTNSFEPDVENLDTEDTVEQALTMPQENAARVSVETESV